MALWEPPVCELRPRGSGRLPPGTIQITQCCRVSPPPKGSASYSLGWCFLAHGAVGQLTAGPLGSRLLLEGQVNAEPDTWEGLLGGGRRARGQGR